MDIVTGVPGDLEDMCWISEDCAEVVFNCVLVWVCMLVLFDETSEDLLIFYNIIDKERIKKIVETFFRPKSSTHSISSQGKEEVWDE